MAHKIRRNQGITVIKKSNQLIEARYKFDVWETRVFLAVLAQIRLEDEDFKTYRIYYRDVVKIFGLRSAQSYSFLRDAARSLLRKVFNVSNVDKGFLRETEYHIIRSVNYLSEDDEASPRRPDAPPEPQEYVDITVDPEMKPLLLQMQKNFTAYDLRNVVKLGAYPVRVYELLKQYESIGERTLQIEQMKRMFELHDEYPMFGNFFQKIIQPALRDINAHTDLCIDDVEKIKAGKKVIALRFRIRAKSGEALRRARGEAPPLAAEPGLRLQFADAKANDAKPNSAAIEGLVEKDRLFLAHQTTVVGDFGVTPSSFFELLEGKSEEQLLQAIRVTRRAKAAGQIGRSLPGFFVEALRKGFTDPAEEAAKKKARAEALAEQIKAAERSIVDLQDEKADRLNARIREITALRPAATEEAIARLRESVFSRALLEEKEAALGRPLEVEDFRQERTLREWVKSTIFELNKSRFDDIAAELEPRLSVARLLLQQLKSERQKLI